MGRDELAAALAADRDKAFPRLVRSLQDGVFSGVLRLTGNRADAEDITQETFVRAYRALRSYPDERIAVLRPREWIWTIALNLCRNRARRRARQAEAVGEDAAIAAADGRPGPEQEALAGAERAELARLLGSLAAPVRTAVVLRHVVGLSYEEIGRLLARPSGTVRSDVHRGLLRLRRQLEGM